MAQDPLYHIPPSSFAARPAVISPRPSPLGAHTSGSLALSPKGTRALPGGLQLSPPPARAAFVLPPPSVEELSHQVQSQRSYPSADAEPAPRSTRSPGHAVMPSRSEGKQQLRTQVLTALGRFDLGHQLLHAGYVPVLHGLDQLLLSPHGEQVGAAAAHKEEALGSRRFIKP